MSTTKQTGGPSPFSEEEVAAVTEGPAGDPELDELDAADIDAPEENEASFEKILARSRKLSDVEIRQVLQAVLFVAPESLTLDQLFDATGIDREKIEPALKAIAEQFVQADSGIVLHEVAGGWQFRTAHQSAEYVRRFLKVKPQRLTRAAVETLALIAYRQPVTRPEIEDVRGVDSGAVLKALLDRRLIKIVGKKEEVGRPILYGTTREFLEFFALKDLASLPTLREFQELTEESREIVEREAPKPVSGIVEELADSKFEEKMAEADKASEAALQELETAIDQADVTSKTAAKILNPPAPPAPEGAAPAAAPVPPTPGEG
ncbi:MAG: SMC-Scp complex subunit ScpB [Myxococcaceae bacterium]